jgi:hypothetical protein
MIRNMGARVLRIAVVVPAAIVIALVLGAGTLAGAILFVVAAILLVTATTGFCPTCVLLGISTHPHGVRRVGHHLRGGHADAAALESRRHGPCL